MELDLPDWDGASQVDEAKALNKSKVRLNSLTTWWYACVQTRVLCSHQKKLKDTQSMRMQMNSTGH